MKMNKYYFVVIEKSTENKVSTIGAKKEIINCLTTRHPLLSIKEQLKSLNEDKISESKILFYTEIEEEIFKNSSNAYPVI